MMNLDLNDFGYDLPDDKIAIYPLENRANCKLLVFNKNEITHSKFNDIPKIIPNDALLILNSTKVLPARILLNKPTGAEIELLLLEPKNNLDYQIAINIIKTAEWKCIVGGKNIKVGDVFYIIYENVSVKVEILKRYENQADVRFSWQPKKLSFGKVLENIGRMPLPPYIKRDVEMNDKENYQTIYANNEGSVAAPTAGLHFTSEILEELKCNGVKINELILHIGLGTFVPISTDIDKHKMHSEKIFVSKETVANLFNQYAKNKPVIATGTTSLRTLESLYWFGIRLIRNEINFAEYNRNNGFYINQNDSNEEKFDISVAESFNKLLDFMGKNGLENIQGSTEIFIVPGYKIRTITGLITNFHLPKSTLMLLISAFIGTDNVKKIYAEALQTDYRFLSYGDSMLLMG